MIALRRLTVLVAFIAVPLGAAAPTSRAAAVQVLTSTGGLPPHIAGTFQDAQAYVEMSNGESLVFDRGSHAVFAIDREKTRTRKIVDVGFERGRILQPSAFTTGPQDTFVVVDTPNGAERVQFFYRDGTSLGGFLSPGTTAPRLILDGIVQNGISSVQSTGHSVFINAPETGALITELDQNGHPIRHIGLLRPTGHEADPDVHLALNVGLPLIDPSGGLYFVFRTGVPMFRKYDANGALVFERHIEGPELDATIASLATTWPRSRREEGELPVVPPIIRTAAIDRDGQLWVSLMTPFTYVYDASGEKIRTVQFHAAGLLTPTSLFFTADHRVLVAPGCYEFRSMERVAPSTKHEARSPEHVAGAGHD